MTPPGGGADRCLWSEGVGEVAVETGPPPDQVDVAIVGGGYTGLAAARAIARHGARVAVLERDRIGGGASGRNGGFVLPGFQPGLAELARRLGEERARTLWAWSTEAVGALERLLAEEAIDCAYARCGSVVLAAHPAHLATLRAEQECLARLAGRETVLLGPEEVGREIGSTRYHGGLVDPLAGALHPGRFVAGLAAAAARAGALLFEGAHVTAIRRTAHGCKLRTSRGALRAGEVVVATDGETGRPFGRLRRRVIPVESHVVATAPLEPALASRLLPGGRVLSDTLRILRYFRLSPDGRLVFGGRVAMMAVGTSRAAAALGRAMREIFPELDGVPVEFAWSGTVGFTLDRLPHAGRLDGIHYALGYCGHGVAMATWLGERMGDVLAGRCEVPDFGALRRVPLYGGTPWFLPVVDAYYRMRDRWN